MKWVSVLIRNPDISGKYFIIGKSNYKCIGQFWADEDYWEFDDNIPSNKVSPENMFWLEETNIEFEN